MTGRVRSVRRVTDLLAEIDALYAAAATRRVGRALIDTEALTAAMREAVLVVPVTGDGADQAPLTGVAGGVRWVLAFTSELELARYGMARGLGARGWAYRTVRGVRLLTGADGVMVDVAGARPVAFPPVACALPADPS